MSLAKLCETFLYEVGTCTSQFILNLPTRHCLFSTLDFSRQLLKETPNVKVVEWAQEQNEVVENGKISTQISRCGHVLTAIFVPVFCSLCIRIQKNGPVYFFDPDFTDGGSKFSLYFPVSLCHGTPEAIIEVSRKYEDTRIPLTLFYAVLRENTDEEFGIVSLQNNLIDHLKQRFSDLESRPLPKKISFVIRGRFLVDEYTQYISNGQVKKISLGNFELVTLYTIRPKELISMLRRLKDFHLLEQV